MKKIILLLLICSSSFAQKFYLSPEVYTSSVNYKGKKDFNNFYDYRDNQKGAFNLDLGVKFFEITYNQKNNFGMQFGLNYRKGNTSFNAQNTEFKGVTNINFDSYRLSVYPFSYSKLAKHGDDNTVYKGTTGREYSNFFFNYFIKGLHFDFGVAPANVSINVTDPEPGITAPYLINKKVTMKVFGWGLKTKVYTHENEKLNIMVMWENTRYTWDDIKSENNNNKFRIRGRYIGVGLVYDII